MCLDVEVQVPVICHFLFKFRLQSGANIVCSWTIIRTVLSLILFSILIPEVIMGMDLTGLLTKYTVTTASAYLACVLCIIIYALGAFLAAFTLYPITMRDPEVLAVCVNTRVLLWFLEMSILIFGAVMVEPIREFFLLAMIFTILSMYGTVVLYSYARELSGQFIGKSPESNPSWI